MVSKGEFLLSDPKQDLRLLILQKKNTSPDRNRILFIFIAPGPSSEYDT